MVQMIPMIRSSLAKLTLLALSTIAHPKMVRSVHVAACALFFFFGMCALAGTVHAFAAPAAGSFAYTVYDVAINQILNGPIGFVAGVGAMVLGSFMAIQQKIPMALPCILGGAVMLSADTMVTTLGMTF